MSPEGGIEGRGSDQPELLLYDYYKHMTTLILATLGGVLSISQISGIAIPLRDLLPSLAMILFGGVTALYGMEGLIRARVRRRPVPRFVLWARPLVSGSFGLGIGAFLGKAANLIN